MPGPRLEPFIPGDLLTVERFNAILEILEDSRSAHLGEGYVGSASASVAPPDRTFVLAEVTEQGSGPFPPHAWKEVYDPHPTTPGDLVDKDYGGVVGTLTLLPLHEINGRVLPVGERLKAWKGTGDYYLCILPCCGDGSAQPSSPVTGDQTAYPLPAATIVKIEVNETSNFYGFEAPANETTVWIYNAGDSLMTLINESSLDIEINRIRTATGGNLWVAPGHVVQLFYSTSINRWIVLCCTSTSYDETHQEFSITTSPYELDLTLPGNPTPPNIDLEITTNVFLTIDWPDISVFELTFTNTSDNFFITIEEIKPPGEPAITIPSSPIIPPHQSITINYNPQAPVDDDTFVIVAQPNPGKINLPQLPIAVQPGNPEAGDIAIYVPEDVPDDGLIIIKTPDGSTYNPIWSEGIPGGQDINGGTDASDDLLLKSTINAVKGGITIGSGDWLNLPEISAPGTPSSGSLNLYVKTDGKVYSKNDAGTETDLSSMDINGLTDLAAPPVDTDYLPIYDASAGTNKKVSVEDLGEAFGIQAKTEGSLAATGNTQGTAAAITDYSTRVTSATFPDDIGVILPSSTSAGDIRLVRNVSGGATINIYPHSGALIIPGSTDSPVSLANGSGTAFFRVSSTEWLQVS